MNDDEWAIFAPFVTSNRSRGGRPPRDHRLTLDGIFWITRIGAQWRDLPDEFGVWNSVLPPVSAVDAAGRLGRSAGRLGRARSRRRSVADDRQHHDPCTSLCCRRKRGTHRQGLGRSRGGFTTKLHAATNADGLPVGSMITPGQTHNAKVATEPPRICRRLQTLRGWSDDEEDCGELFAGSA
ncbi:hypothetical protein IMSHALPRED_004610 [Imshaugia aleurites]|uniref:Insertion element IS402-like domain-containing protein n=1 Tax=Imshaugia aleurites TaxID=172621 RepID=A0A8H3J8I6_9LECA|nr:hypothetical protein IMSHALPRED_004610 [Imshaugia aleurites]